MIFKADEISRWLYIHPLQSSSFSYNSVTLWQQSVEYEQTFWIRVLHALSLRPHQIVLRVDTGKQPENQGLRHKHVHCSSRRMLGLCLIFCKKECSSTYPQVQEKDCLLVMSSYNWVISPVSWFSFGSHKFCQWWQTAQSLGSTSSHSVLIFWGSLQESHC